jgi:hypothetical protein
LSRVGEFWLLRPVGLLQNSPRDHGRYSPLSRAYVTYYPDYSAACVWAVLTFITLLTMPVAPA